MIILLFVLYLLFLTQINTGIKLMAAILLEVIPPLVSFLTIPAMLILAYYMRTKGQ